LRVGQNSGWIGILIPRLPAGRGRRWECQQKIFSIFICIPENHCVFSNSRPLQKQRCMRLQSTGCVWIPPFLVSQLPESLCSMLSLPSTPRRLQPQALWLLLVCGIVASGWSTSLEASCGDYVLIGNPRAVAGEGMSGEHGKPVGVSGRGVVHPLGLMDADNVPPPCHGPHCRQRNAPQDLPVPTTVVLDRSDACLNSVSGVIAVVDAGELVMFSAEIPAVLSGRGLYRPPRIS
jgi:hypothetical protein